jgi:phosphoesterase RecJ-like protein
MAKKPHHASDQVVQLPVPVSAGDCPTPPDGTALATAAAMAQVLAGASRVLVTGHPDPDGDVAGSGSALCCALESLGKDVLHFNPDPFPPGFRNLPGARGLCHAIPASATFDVTVILDAGRMDRVRPHLPPPHRRGTVLWIDHHPLQEPCGDLDWVDVEAASVGEMLHVLLGLMGVRVDHRVGTGLYASLLADTGGFRYQATKPRTLRLAAELLEAGVGPWDVAEQVYEREPVERVRLLTRVLLSLSLGRAGRCATIVVTQGDLAQTGATAAMTDGMINHARGIAGVEVAGQLEELPGETGWRVTLRSRGVLPASDVTAHLHPREPGHRFWASYHRPGPVEAIREELEAAVDRAVRARRGSQERPSVEPTAEPPA